MYKHVHILFHIEMKNVCKVRPQMQICSLDDLSLSSVCMGVEATGIETHNTEKWCVARYSQTHTRLGAQLLL